MKIFEITALLMVLTALFSFINYRVLRMPTTIGVIFKLWMASLTWLRVIEIFRFANWGNSYRAHQKVDWHPRKYALDILSER
jgi:hypothetical protein